MAVNQLHFHIMEKLQGIKELLAYESDEKLAMAEELADAVVSSVTIDSLVIGVLEEAFFEMVSLCHVGCLWLLSNHLYIDVVLVQKVHVPVHAASSLTFCMTWSDCHIATSVQIYLSSTTVRVALKLQLNLH